LGSSDGIETVYFTPSPKEDDSSIVPPACSNAALAIYKPKPMPIFEYFLVEF